MRAPTTVSVRRAPRSRTREGAAPWRTETLRERSNRRSVETDPETGRVELVIEDDFGELRDLEHGLVNGSTARERWTIDPRDPLSAQGRTHWTQTLSREGWSVRMETFTTMSSDADRFHLKARIEAYEGDVLVFGKDFEESLPRMLV